MNNKTLKSRTKTRQSIDALEARISYMERKLNLILDKVEKLEIQNKTPYYPYLTLAETIAKRLNCID